jgi:acetone carboxylase alpha subunit
VYGAVFSSDSKGSYTVDVGQNPGAPRKCARKAGPCAAHPRLDAAGARADSGQTGLGTGAAHVCHQFCLSDKFSRQFKAFWSLPDEWQLLESELGVPSYGAKHRMDLSLLPDVTTVVQVEE